MTLTHLNKYTFTQTKDLLIMKDLLKGSYPFCNDGSMKNNRMDRFSKVATGQQFHQTDAYSGH